MRSGANHDAVRVLGVGEGGAFPEELGVAHHIEHGAVHGGIHQDLLDPVTGANGHGGLGDNDGVVADVLGDIARHGPHGAQVGFAIIALRGAHGNEHHFAVLHAFIRAGRDLK